MEQRKLINTDVNPNNPSQEEFDDGRSYNLEAVKLISQEWLENTLKQRFINYFINIL